MQSSREDTLELIKRWQSENCLIRFDFILKDYVLQMRYSHSFNAIIVDAFGDGAFSLIDRKEPDRQIHIKLTPDCSYDITDIEKEAHPTFQATVSCRTILRINFGELGVLVLYEPETHNPKKVM